MKNKILLTTISGEECPTGLLYKVNFEIECDMQQIDPILTNFIKNVNHQECNLNIFIKSKYGKIYIL